MKTDTFKESLAFGVLEGSMDEAKHTVRVCALAPCMSKNGRYYSPAVVESAMGTLIGKKSYADHDTRDTKNVIGKIIGEELVDGKLYADIKVSKAGGIAKQTWEKLKDGTLTDVSIAANGTQKRIKIGDTYGMEVTKLDIQSVDVVTEGGVEAAKVVRVYENAKDIPDVTEVKETMIENVIQLREEYPDLVKEVEAAKDEQILKLETENKELTHKLTERALNEFKEAEILKLEASDKLKDIMRTRVIGETEEAIAESLKKEFEYAQSLVATKEEVKIEGVPPVKLKEVKDIVWSSTVIREDARIPENLKGEAIETFWQNGKDAMLAFLAKGGVKL